MLSQTRQTAEEQQGAEGLVPGGRGDLSIHGQIGEKGFDFRHALLARMALVVKEEVPFDAIDVGFFRANGVASTPYGVANLIQEFVWSIFHRVSRLTNEGFRVHSSKAQV